MKIGHAGETPKGDGPLIAAYDRQPRRWLAALALPLAFLATGGVTLLVGLLVWNTAYTQFGPAAAERDAAVWYQVAAVMLTIAVCALLDRFYRAAFGLGIYKFGLAFQRPLRRAQTVRWEELAGLAVESTAITITGDPQTTPIQTRHQAAVFLRQGAPIRLAAFCPQSTLPAAITQIKANLYPRLLPDFRVQLRRGEWATFGPLAIHASQGLRIPGRRGPLGNGIPWAAVHRIHVRAGFLVVESDKQADISISVGRIPNLELLLQLIQEEVKQ